MSWAAHQFEVYAVQAHLPKKMRGKVSFWGIWLGDFTPDFLSKFWVYGITINGRRYGASIPQQWHRGWPGMGFTHALFTGILIASALWLWRRNRALTVGYLLGYAAHALTDVNDSVGTMLIFPFSTLNWTLQTWAYAATKSGGKYLDAAAYYSSLGLVMDLFWMLVVLSTWRVLTREHWRTSIVPADPHVWAWLGRFMPERALLALYRATFFYGFCRMVAWSTWEPCKRRSSPSSCHSSRRSRTTLQVPPSVDVQARNTPTPAATSTSCSSLSVWARSCS